MDPKLTEAINELMPSPADADRLLMWPYGKLTTSSLDDETFVILGLRFTRMDMFKIHTPTPLRRAIFIIEDRESGEVHMTECSRLSQGFGLIKSGKIGAIFEKRFGEDFLNHLRVWYAYEGGDIEKYHIETYLLGRMADKRRAEERARVMLRNYNSMSIEQRNAWRAKYPYAAEVVLKDHEDYHLRRA